MRRGLAHARRVGSRYWEWTFLGSSYAFYGLGAWDEVLAMWDELPHEDWMQARPAYGSVLTSALMVCVHRGRLGEAERMVEGVAEFERSADIQERAQYGAGKAQILLAQGDHAEALEAAESVFAQRDSHGIALESVKEAFALAVQGALALDRLDKAEELVSIVERLPPGGRPQFLNAHVARFRALLAAREGNDEEVERLFKRAAGLFQELALPFPVAVARLEHAEWLASREADAQALLAEARDTFSALEARPWLERLDGVQAGSAAEVPA